MKHVFVINPVAGKGRHTEQLREAVLRATRARGIEAEIYVTRCAEDGERYVRERACGGEELRFYACGGDGTLNELLNGIYGFDNAELASVPVGSGNDFIKNFSDTAPFSDIEAQLDGAPSLIDVMRCNGRYAMNLANIGFDGDVARRMIHFKKWPLMSGHGAYTLAVVVTFLQRFGNTLKVTFDNGRTVVDTMILTAIGNGICYGGGYYATPQARIDDGLLDVCLVSRLSRLNILRLIGLYKAGQHIGNPLFKPYLTFERCRSLVVEGLKPLQLCVDGEILQEKERIEFSVADQKVRFVLPKGVALPQREDAREPVPAMA